MGYFFCLTILQFTYSFFVVGNLCCFQFLAIINKAATSTVVDVFGGHSTRSGFVGSHDQPMFGFNTQAKSFPYRLLQLTYTGASLVAQW